MINLLADSSIAFDATFLIAIATNVVGFALVVVATLALFGHSGQTEMSARRRIAIATGQADRQTPFESTALGPLMWLLLQFTTSLAIPGAKRRLRAKLVAAGSPNLYTAEEYLALTLLWAFGAAAALMGLDLLLFGNVSFVTFWVGLVLGMGLCLYYIHDLAARRVRDISRRVPYSLDLVALAMGAGSTFPEAIRTVIREDPTDPMNVELNTILAEMDLGVTRRQALVNLADRVPLESLRSIVASIIQAEELGTPLGDVLKSQASLLRMHRSVRAEKLAALASVRILIPSVLILLSVVLTVFAPIIIRVIHGQLF